MSEEQLIRRAQQGDNSAFEQLLLAHQKKVYNLCLRMAANPDDALDLSQEAFIKAWRALGQYQFEASFSTWLFCLTSNVCIDFRARKSGGRKRLSQRITTTVTKAPSFRCRTARRFPSSQAITNETKIELARAMGQLARTTARFCSCGSLKTFPTSRLRTFWASASVQSSHGWRVRGCL